MSDWVAATIHLLNGHMVKLTTEEAATEALRQLAAGQLITLDRPGVNEYVGLGRCRTTEVIPPSVVARIVQHRAA